MLVRVLPPPETSKQTVIVHGRTYTGTLGKPLDVPQSVASVLGANGWQVIGDVGTTANRPTARPDGGRLMGGERYVDTDVGALLVFDRETWRNAITGAAA